MEAKKLEATLRVDAEGRLQGDAELLARMTNQTFTARLEGTTITLRPQRLHEIVDVDERMRAFDEFVKKVARPTGVQWAADYNVRDDIYD